MENKDILLSVVGAEEPIPHIVSINQKPFNIAFELQKIILLGGSINSINSEYRAINLNTNKVTQLLKGDLKQECGIFYRFRDITFKHVKQHTISYKKKELKNISGHGICLSLIYYIILKDLNYTEEQYVDLNEFALIVEIINVFDELLDKVSKPVGDLKRFTNTMLGIDDSPYRIGSKLLTISRHQIDNTSDLSHSIWKSMYINRIIRNISSQVRKQFLAPSLDWGIIHYPCKHLFTNSHLLSKLQFGSNINYIRSSSIKQHKLIQELVAGNTKNRDLDDIKALTSQLVDTTIDIDYTLDDISIVAFYPNLGKTLFNAFNTYVDDTKEGKRSYNDNVIKSIIEDVSKFKQLIFQFIYSLMLLSQYGIIHNDPHLNNVLFIEQPSSKMEVLMPSGKVMYIGECNFNITVIDYDKSILSHHHHNFFDQIGSKINEELGIVFDNVKKTIVSNYSQVFNCYAMYDIVRFCLVIGRVLEDASQSLSTGKTQIDTSKHEAFLSKVIKLSTDIMYKIYDENATFPFDISETHGSITWIIETIFKDYMKLNKTKSSIETAAQLAKMKSSVSNQHPEFISSRRKFAEKLKSGYIAEYASKAGNR